MTSQARHTATPEPEETTKDVGPTDSHALSHTKEHEDIEITPNPNDVYEGWIALSSKDVKERIIPSIPNEDLWMLIRRFNKQMFSVRAIPDTPTHGLDLNRTGQEQFSPIRLRATLERFYIVIVLSLANFLNHVVRLRSWKEPRRTSAFCMTYFFSWLLDLLVPTSITALIALAVYPPSRKWMFPPAPIALIDTDTGGVQKPKAGVLGSHDSITGAPERLKGEASEREAQSLMNSIGSLAVGSTVGKHDQGVPENAPIESSVPDAMDITSNAADARAAAHGEVPEDSHDKTRQPMNAAVMDGAGKAMRLIGDVVDHYERFGNALSPTPPFSTSTPRMRMGAILGTALLLSLVISSYAFMKIITFGIGVGFFGDPIFQRTIQYLNKNYPRWTDLLVPANTLLKGIPTNSQLTLTLLRVGEANAAPLPPPQVDLREKPPSRPASIHSSEVDLGVSKEELHQAAAPGTPSHEKETKDEKEHHKTWVSSVIGLFRRTTAVGIESKLFSSRIRAALGSETAKTRVGVLNTKGHAVLPSGPTEFAARYKSKKGVVVIDSSKDPPLLFFTTEPSSVWNDQRLESAPNGSVRFSIPVSDIQEIRKVDGLGWKGKLVAGWAFKSKEVVDGMVLVRRGEKQETYQLMAMPTRDELFNRLLAIDGQVWESC
ncbi:hypothetical protein PHISCL_01192 [Aspergillus sclerotialis]|uniref:Uncharacterized protein n=1 Tax=Aspergillus sclerotialis TaxID=2070753 RepID=A0A3A2ZTK4_9EURO|nr:hypothetical protein PHISCL_01192 [Aspergillus sclerotialis]